MSINSGKKISHPKKSNLVEDLKWVWGDPWNAGIQVRRFVFHCLKKKKWVNLEYSLRYTKIYFLLQENLSPVN